MRLFKPHQLVELWWTDSTTTHSWSKSSEIRHGEQNVDVHSVGFVVRDTGDEITFTASFSLGTDYPYLCMHTVPKCSIKLLRALRLPRTRRRKP